MNKIPAPDRLKRTNSGFTLIEILIVIALIGILSTALWSNLIQSIYKGKDARRKQDLSAIAKSLELYYNDNISYPAPPLDFGNPLTHPDDASIVYMAKIPTDPGYPDRNYCYDGGADFYRLYANLEISSDPDVLEVFEACPADGVEYNYLIKSTNLP
ncbi:MAG: general secretion pathway protein G, general secretion pathway protein G [Candidatus Gottesmanbacteria bacterium GW2011_GWA2_43_14]|uniref:General secretion pathway protein G, general secretion pathway protein G n=1 Tax=Candidatus Gottesmanbacteria bacterium GW2011_GWA2_43_14 TaxID=1618443 RepID=A0A0G1FNW8_9BACT|nr:MAG: general secretion pathway protein G, general secretion pathway protein G [Candidatus Gottesmanbacteria bacterium GW2011_GWA2_43_14]